MRYSQSISATALLNKSKILVINTQFAPGPAKELGLYGGVGYYRQRMMAKHLKEYTFNHVGHILLKTPEEKLEETIVGMVKSHDLVFSKHLDNPAAIYMLLGACDFYKKPLLIDFDDNIFSTDGKCHPNYVYPEGDARRYLEVLLTEATGITVSTEPLLEVYGKYNNVHLVSNACDPKDWTLKRKHHKRFTIGWAGSASHSVDHPILEPVYEEIIKKYPEVVFSFTGHMLPEHVKFPRQNWELKPAIGWWEGNPDNSMTYPRLLAELGYDIGLAPIQESQFNEARSLVKWFEYTMVGTPMIASKFGPYKNLHDGKDAFLCTDTKDWVNAISYLYENTDVRESTVTHARKSIDAKYTINHLLPTWRSLFETYLGRGFK